MAATRNIFWAQNAFAAGAPPRTHFGKLRVLLRPPSRATSGRKGEWDKKNGRGEKEQWFGSALLEMHLLQTLLNGYVREL